MAYISSIEWTNSTWSPFRVRVRLNAATIAAENGYTSLIQIAQKRAGRVGHHCEAVSKGCQNCYSETFQARCLPASGTGLPFDRRSRDLIEAYLDTDVLRQPFNWRKPRKIFVENQSDPFGEWYKERELDAVYSVMVGAHWHTFQVLTKRIQRAKEHLARFKSNGEGWLTPYGESAETSVCLLNSDHWPIRNIWLGTSVEDEPSAKYRIPELLACPAARRFVSYEPALGPVDFRPYLEQAGDAPRLDLVIFGGESGTGARPCDLKWAIKTAEHCEKAGVCFFMKQAGAKPYMSMRDLDARMPGKMVNVPHRFKDSKGGDISEWPSVLQIRQLPEAHA